MGYIDRDTVIRVVTGMMGLWMAWYGNRMPKTMVPVPASAGQARRVASWSLVLSGLVYAGLWAFAPIPVAVWGRERRDPGGCRRNARLLPVVAGQSESPLIQSKIKGGPVHEIPQTRRPCAIRL